MITGSNGSGKSTVGPDYLPKPITDNYKIFDGDKIFMAKRKELFPDLIKSPKEAKRIAADFVIEALESLLEDALIRNDHFVYEGHFPSYATWNFPKRFKSNGYTIEMLFLGLNDIDISEMRVGIRAKKGGHNVPRWDIENNFFGNLEMLNEHYHLLDHLQIVDTSEFIPKPLASFRGENLVSSVEVGELPQWFTKYLPLLSAKININS